MESFNNAALIYHEKRIVFGTQEYNRRSMMAVTEWNENVDRDFSSVTHYVSHKATRQQLGKKNLVPKTFKFYSNIWNRVMDSFYS